MGIHPRSSTHSDDPPCLNTWHRRGSRVPKAPSDRFNYDASGRLHPNGQIKEKGTYKKGKKIGTHLGFWPNGSLRFKKNYKIGLLNGEQKQWHKNGILARLSSYKEGKEQGQQKGWRNNGDLRYNYQIINNKRYGFIGSKTCVPVEM